MSCGCLRRIICILLHDICIINSVVINVWRLTCTGGEEDALHVRRRGVCARAGPFLAKVRPIFDELAAVTRC